MKMKINPLYTLALAGVLFSCGDAEPAEENQEKSNISEIEEIDFDDVEMSDEIDNSLMLCINVHNEVNPIDLPYEEKMNYDIYDPYYPLTNDEIYAFHLDTLGVDTNMFVNLDYWVDLSPDYSTYVFNIELNENELATYMVTYFGDYSYIDSKMIAYDEIAESMSRAESKIEKDQITINSYMYYGEEPEVKTEVVYIDENGNFQEK